MVSGPVNLIAYLRVSSEAQDTQLQRDALGEAGCTKFFEDKISSRQPDRPGLSAAMEYLRRGDTLVVWKLDRLGRSVKDVVGRGKWLTLVELFGSHRPPRTVACRGVSTPEGRHQPRGSAK